MAKINFSINFKAKPTKDPELIKIEMIFYRPNYARLSRLLNVTGLSCEWDEIKQLFKENNSENTEKNILLRDEKLKFLKVAEQWEGEGTEYSPKQWADYFVTVQPKKQTVKIITVSAMIDKIIQRKNEKMRIINNFEVSCRSTGIGYKYLKSRLNEFSKAKYKKEFSTYYFADLTTAFVEDFLYFLKKRGIDNNHAGNIPNYFKTFYGVVYYATEDKIPNADLTIFSTIKNETLAEEPEPQTIPNKVMEKIENYDRSQLTPEECEYLDYYLFSYYAGGMPPINAAYLEWSSIDENQIIRYKRFKTGKKAEVPFVTKAQEIVNKYSYKCYNNFVLPIYNHKQKTERQKEMRRKRITEKVNETIQKIAKSIGYSDEIEWYSARGTFITHMINLGYNAFDIAKMCGNSVMAIEKSYFKQTSIMDIKSRMEESFSAKKAV